jgi:hypothetical protein
MEWNKGIHEGEILKYNFKGVGVACYDFSRKRFME